MVPSAYQRAIYQVFQRTNRNLNIQAVAGSGKTTVLLELLKYVPSRAHAIFLAFNNSIVNELRDRNKRDNVQITTLHSCGWRAIMNRYGRVKMNPNKAIAKTEVVLKRHNITDVRRGYYFYIVPKIVDLMRCNLCTADEKSVMELTTNYGLDLVDKDDVKIILEAFELMTRDRSQFDFMDMIYVPVTDATVRLTKFDYVFCDESQDFSVCQQELIKRVISRTGRLVTVGDPRQAIYGFAGADAESYSKLAAVNGSSVTMPLSVCYRCARSIVREANSVVPEIHYAPTAVEGVVREGSLLELQQGDWVVCRNLKPLIQTYLWLMRNKIKSVVRGKDIGEGILALISKIGRKTIAGLLRGLDDEHNAIERRLRERGVRKPELHPKMELFLQRQEVISYLCTEVDSVQALCDLIRKIFSDDVKAIVLSTIHKSKGLENDRVFFLIPGLIPSRFAVMDWQFEQEENLRYVAITRAKRELVYVSSEMFLQDLRCEIKKNKYVE